MKLNKENSRFVIAGIFLTLIGTFRVFCFFFRLQWPLPVAEAFLFSPRPDPMAAFGGYEDFQYAFELDLISRDHRRYKLNFDKAQFQRLLGPHQYKITYTTAISFLPLSPARLSKVLAYALCRGGPLAKIYLLPDNLKSFNLVLRGKTDNRTMTIPMSCPS